MEAIHAAGCQNKKNSPFHLQWA